MKIIFALLILFIACTFAFEERQINFGEKSGQTPSFVVHGFSCDKFIQHEAISTASTDCFTVVAFPFSPNDACGVSYRRRYKPWHELHRAVPNRIAVTCFNTKHREARISLSVVGKHIGNHETEKTSAKFFINVFSKPSANPNHYQLEKFSYTPFCGDSKAGRCYDYRIEACCEDSLCGPVVKECTSVYDNNENHRNKVKGGFIYNYDSDGFHGGEGFVVPGDSACKAHHEPHKKDGESFPFIDSPWNIHKYGSAGSYQAGNGKCCYGISPAVCGKYCKSHHHHHEGHSEGGHTGAWYPGTKK